MYCDKKSKIMEGGLLCHIEYERQRGVYGKETDFLKSTNLNPKVQSRERGK